MYLIADPYFVLAELAREQCDRDDFERVMGAPLSEFLLDAEGKSRLWEIPVLTTS